MVTTMSKIDVHHHVYPDVYRLALQRAGGDPSGWYVPPWTLEADQGFNHLVGVKTAIISMTAPGPCIEKDPQAAADLARRGNQAMAALRDSMPDKYGFFASLPSPLDDQAATLREIAHGCDELDADGVVLFTRYGPDNHYLGHPDFRPMWEELNRRKAVVFIHPTHPVDKNFVNPHLPQPMFDYAHETGRTAMDLILSGTLECAPECKIILSHAGGTLPWLIYRPAGMLPHTPFEVGKSTDELVAQAQRFYFDTALSATPYTIPLLLQFAKPGHILFGSDFPNAPTPSIEFFTGNLSRHGMDETTRAQIDHESALELFPRLKQA